LLYLYFTGKSPNEQWNNISIWEGIMNFLANMVIVETIIILKNRGV
jgi:hypothetical protein